MTTPAQTADKGFLTTKEAVTLPALSLVIWTATAIVYKAIYLVDKNINYEASVFFISLTLSILSTTFFISQLIKNTIQPTKTFLIVLNAITLYSSANGIQAGYSFLATVPGNQQQKSATTIHQSFFIPFMDPRPWIPDATIKVKKDQIENEKKALVLENSKLKSDLLQKTKEGDGYLALAQENAKLKSDLSQKTNGANTYIALVQENAKLKNDAKLSAQWKSQSVAFAMENDKMKNQIESILSDKAASQPEMKKTREMIASLKDKIREMQDVIDTQNKEIEELKGQIKNQK